MAQHDGVIANASGAAVRSDLNNALAALITNSSGATAPATTYAYQWWADTTANQLKLRNSANDDWIVIQELDGTMLMEDGTAAAPGLAFSDDVDTGLFRPAANQLGIATSGVERVEFGTTEVVFNDSGADVDFRVEGDAEASLFVVDAGNDRIGIAESAPGTLVEIGSAAPYVTLKNSTEEDTDGGRESRLIFEGEQSGGEISTLAQIEVSHDGTADDEQGKLVISTNDGSDGASPTAALTISADQTVAVEDNLTVNGNQYPTAGALSNRNLIINGAMKVAQRGATSASVTATGYHGPDRYRFIVQAGTFTISRSSTAPDGFSDSWKADCTATATLTGTQACIIQQRIEAQDLQHLKFGTASAEELTLSFWVRSNLTGVFTVEAFQDDDSRQVSKEVTISSADTWEYKTVSIPADTTGVIDDDNGPGLDISFWLDAGPDLQSGTLNTSGFAASVNANRVSSSNIELTGNTANEFYLTGVQLEIGAKATPFEHRSYGDELAKCQRYYQRGRESYYAYMSSGGSVESVGQFATHMRATPTTASVISSTLLGFGTAAVANLIDETAVRISYSSSAAGFNGARVQFEADAEL